MINFSNSEISESSNLHEKKFILITPDILKKYNPESKNVQFPYIAIFRISHKIITKNFSLIQHICQFQFTTFTTRGNITNLLKKKEIDNGCGAKCVKIRNKIFRYNLLKHIS